MAGFRYIQAGDIVSWVERRVDATSLLPVLLRKLVVATCPGEVVADFPGDKGVNSPGWDGQVSRVPPGLRFVPEGSSVWELSIDRHVFSKASSDFAKRSRYPSGIDPARTTFVAVTGRQWRSAKNDKHGWVRRHKLKRVWADVVALDAHDLASWLELAPQVAIWLSQEMGLPYPREVRDLARAADRFLNQGPPPPLALAALRVSREHELNRVHEWLRGKNRGPLIIEAGSPEEATTFFAAATDALPAVEREAIECRTLVVFNREDFFELVDSHPQGGLFVIAQFADGLGSARYATNKLGHRVVLPTPQGDQVPDCTRITLGPLAQDVFTKTLAARGIGQETIHQLELATRRDLTAVTRKLEGAPAPWLNALSPRALFTLMFTRTWRDTQKGDQEYIEAISGTPYEEFVEHLGEWPSRADSPVRKFGDVWKVVAAEEIMQGIGHRVTQPVLSRWQKEVTGVLCTPNPKYELKAAERFAAAIKGKSPVHSEELRSGLVSSLNDLAASPPSRWLATVSADEAVDAIVAAVLRWADEWKKWASLHDILPALAEASPDVFLARVQGTLDDHPRAITDLFREDSDLGGSPWVGLLWAVEQFAWEPAYFSRAMLSLAEWAERDPGGKNGPRPAGAIERVLCFWRPQTRAPVAARQQFIETLAARFPRVAWKILRDLMPGAQGVTSDITKPRWRKWHEGAADNVTEGEYWTMTLFAVERLLGLASEDKEKLGELLHIMLDMPKERLAPFLDDLRKFAQRRSSPKAKALIWARLRQLLHDNRKFPDADNAISPETLKQLEDLYTMFSPPDVVERLVWLFDQHPALPTGGSDDWEKENEEIARARFAAFDELLRAGGVPTLLHCIDTADSPWALGHALAHFPNLDERLENEFLAATLPGRTRNRLLAAHGYIFVRSRGDAGNQWQIEKLPRRIKERINFLIGLPFAPATWDRVESDAQIAQEYWAKVSADRIVGDTPALDRAIRALLRAKRPVTALALAGSQVRNGVSAGASPALLLEVLDNVVRSDGKNPADPVRPPLLSHWLREVFAVVGAAPELDIRQVASLEFNLIELFGHGSSRGPLALQRLLDERPEFFAELIANTFRAKGQPARKSIPKDQARLAERSYRALKQWRSMPGRDSTGDIDPAKLSAWITRARQLNRKQKRLEVADSLIGDMLARAPTGADGCWPSESLRTIFEEQTTERIRNGIRIGLLNKRSGGFRGRQLGGADERASAADHRHQAEVLQPNWPMIASIHRAMAESYEWQAKRHDREAEEERNSD